MKEDVKNAIHLVIHAHLRQNAHHALMVIYLMELVLAVLDVQKAVKHVKTPIHTVHHAKLDILWLTINASNALKDADLAIPILMMRMNLNVTEIA